MPKAWASPIVVGFDGSPDSMRALDWALGEADLRDAPVTLCHAWRGSHSSGATGGGAVDEPEAAAQRVLAEGCRRAAQQAPSVQLRAQLIAGNPAEALAQAADDATLIVVGARGAGGLHDRLLGSVSAGLARHAPCPVVVVRDGGSDEGESEGARGGRIVVGIDGPADCETALEFAFQEAARREGTVHAVHAFDEASLQTVAYLDEGELQRLRLNAQDDFGALLAPQAEKYPGVVVSFALIHGGPAPALIEASAAADLLVLGSHGHGRLATAVLGSTSHGVLHHAACPVAVVRGEG
jgi:nucleotide-binding universal stress UspA family protein